MCVCVLYFDTQAKLHWAATVVSARRLHRAATVVKGLKKYKLDIVGLQETHMNGSGIVALLS